MTAAKNDIEALSSAVTLYRLDTNRFPEQLRDLVDEPEDVSNWNGPYLDKKRTPRDPWDNEYEFRAPGENGRDFDIWSFGEDGQEGGEGLAADIISWEGEDD